jgi:hypothetical protein
MSNDRNFLSKKLVAVESELNNLKGLCSFLIANPKSPITRLDKLFQVLDIKLQSIMETLIESGVLNEELYKIKFEENKVKYKENLDKFVAKMAKDGEVSDEQK